MIGSADGRATIDGRAGGLGSPADRAVLRALRAPADALLVGPGTLIAERYATLLDPEQRELRDRARSIRPSRCWRRSRARSILAWRTCRCSARPDAQVRVYTEASGELAGQRGRRCSVRRPEPLERARLPRAIWRPSDGARLVVTEGGPTLLRELVAERPRRRPRADARAVPRRRRGPLGAARPAARSACAHVAARRAARRGPPVPALRARRRRERSPATDPRPARRRAHAALRARAPARDGDRQRRPRLVLRQRAPRHARAPGRARAGARRRGRGPDRRRRRIGRHLHRASPRPRSRPSASCR